MWSTKSRYLTKEQKNNNNNNKQSDTKANDHNDYHLKGKSWSTKATQERPTKLGLRSQARNVSDDGRTESVRVTLEYETNPESAVHRAKIYSSMIQGQ